MKRDEALRALRELRETVGHWRPKLEETRQDIQKFDEAIAALSSPCACGEDDTCPTCGGPVTKIRRTEDLFAHDIGYFDYHTKPCACGEPIAVVKGWIEIPHDLNWIPQSLYTLTGNRAWEPQVPVRVLVFDALPDEEAKG